MIWIFIALLSPWIASSEPLAGNIGAPIGFDYDALGDSQNDLLPPLSSTDGNIHWLGTDSVGRDVAAGMVHGASVAFIICLLTIFLSVVIGLLIGIIMGFYGNKGLRVNIPQVLWGIGCLLPITYYKTDILLLGWSWWSAGLTVLLTALLFTGWWLLYRLPLRKYGFPMDSIWLRVFEVKESLPNLFLLLAISAIIATPSIWSLVFTLVMLYWVTFARYSRAEMLQLKNEDFLVSARASGIPTWRLLTHHAMPNLISPILVVIAFSLSGVILVESSLSFLGIGLPLEEVTWGKILAEARKSSSAWWLAVFPGLAIFALVFAFNTVADEMRG